MAKYQEPTFADLPYWAQVLVGVIIIGVLLYAFVFQPIVNWFQSLSLLHQILIIVVPSGVVIFVYLFFFTNIFLSEEERKKIEKEEAEWLLKLEEEEKLERSILRKKIMREREKELEGLTKKEKEFLINKWIEEALEKEYLRKEEEIKPKIEKVPPLSTREKERLIRIVGTRCCYPNCRESMVLDVHHIVPRAEGGTNKETNLIVLCTKHHRLARGGTIPRERLRQYCVANIKKIR